MFKSYQEGISLYISIIILAIILAVVLGLNTILLGQIKIIRGMGYSVIAYYAAETGSEMELYRIYVDKLPPHDYYAGSLDLNGNGNAFGGVDKKCPEDLLIIDPDDSCYYIKRITDLSECGSGAFEYCFRTVGYYKGTRRAFELTQ